jgi:hypothetical protein
MNRQPAAIISFPRPIFDVLSFPEDGVHPRLPDAERFHGGALSASSTHCMRSFFIALGLAAFPILTSGLSCLHWQR